MPYFGEEDAALVFDFMQAHPFVTLIGYDGRQNVATQVPVLLSMQDGKVVIRAHVMRNTDHHKALLAFPDVLILFQGPHCYVSSSWYTGKMGATWNYQTVHVRGKVNLLSDNETIGILDELTRKYEKPQADPLLIQDLPDGYVSTLVKAIAGISITATDIIPIFKLSQNRDDASYISIVDHLLATDDNGAHTVAAEMKKKRLKLF
ncbi:MAG: FMN-binding negative transcriptional regulator [Taibaiella sp.]|nr:FMN-binding negative transcriptional regulator [Taibaiella sp.]